MQPKPAFDGRYETVDLPFYRDHIAPILPPQVLDFHVHTWLPEHRKVDPLKTGAAGAKYVVTETVYGAEALVADLEMIFPDRAASAVCFGNPTPSADLEKSNAYLAAAGEREDMFPLMIVGRDLMARDQLECAIRDGRFFGYKVFLNWHGNDYGSVTIPDMIGPIEMQLADELSLVVLLHVPRSGRLADPTVQEGVALAKDYPNANIVLAHCGRCYVPDEMKAAIGAVADLDNVFLDTAMVMDPTVLQIAVEGVGSRRVLFATDLPVAAMRGRRVYAMDHWVDIVLEGYPVSEFRLASDGIRATFMAYEIVLAIRLAAEAVGLTTDEMRAIFWDNGIALKGDFTMENMNIGIVGACGRGASFKVACDAVNMKVLAVCDTNAEGLDKSAESLGADEKYTDYETMLAKSNIDAVIVGTPMPLHVPQSIAALKENLHVLSEVPAGVSIDECKDLVQAAKASSGVYMMAENYTYIRWNVIVREIVRQGLFGTPYYAEGEYVHELKGLNEVTRWRHKWQAGINGVTYPTHSLGPILQWMSAGPKSSGDRVVSVCCAGSGHHYRDPRGDEYETEDSCVMLCKMASSGLVKIRVDMLSDRPSAMTNYQLQGTDGCYESARAEGEPHRIWLRSKCDDAHTWMNLSDLEDEFLPDFWKEGEENARKVGHGGGDYFEILDFVDAINGTKPCPVGIHEAMDMTLPGLVSQLSIAQGGRWLEVPDSREW